LPNEPGAPSGAPEPGGRVEIPGKIRGKKMEKTKLEMMKSSEIQGKIIILDAHFQTNHRDVMKSWEYHIETLDLVDSPPAARAWDAASSAWCRKPKEAGPTYLRSSC
jgi:hypothetical protein